MKLLRISAAALSLSLFAVLAACGGGGGNVTPNPGNGGGGPTPVPTATPTAGPTATPTPTSAPSGGSLTVSSTVYTAYDGANHTWGTDNWQKNGVTDAGDPGDGDVTNNVASGTQTDGLSANALPNETAAGNGYHHHVFVGIYVNGNPMALPDAIGMNSPSSDDPITSFAGAYPIHTHGEGGIVHIEDPSIAQSNTSPPQFNLQALMDIWGQSLTNLAGGNGLPAIYVGTPSTTVNGEDLVNSYSLYTGSPANLVFQKHTAIWLIYGAPPAGGVPQVAFGIST
jgi:hypothetical protein